MMLSWQFEGDKLPLSNVWKEKRRTPDSMLLLLFLRIYCLSVLTLIYNCSYMSLYISMRLRRLQERKQQQQQQQPMLLPIFISVKDTFFMSGNGRK